ncbi:hypothetical protein PMAYCL1PPCAC_32516 [Pristionchus mayeri]|uniref:Fibronectin type-III domain-containing protein n=1 Tax=Pristionchus mayeri TaxID=1317129 RepID=A0AAN5DG37_9BILA|nr:hypothetical protein PMAYCL1PPCAC_32516 [Pristionchus mayeri]
MRWLLLLVALPTIAFAYGLPAIRDLKARYHPQTSTIFVEWTFPQPLDNVAFNVRYRMNKPGGEHWKTLRTADPIVRLIQPHLADGDELHVQVNAERHGRIIEDWSQVLVITVTKKAPNGEAQDALVPPTAFTANILDTTSVRLEWKPVEEGKIDGKDIYYVVNVKQLTTRSGGVLQRQQIKTSERSFTMGRLIPGEKYELTIRSAVSDAQVSSMASIVEITMPRDEEFFEIGNLIISSLFKNSGSGTVNLTWDVPPAMVDNIKGYDVQYSEAGKDEWETIKFGGAQSSASLHGLKSDTQYLLKIRTQLKNEVYTESGQFNFKTPKVAPNAIKKVDVIYSHEVNSVRLQWMLEPHIHAATVAGYDVYVSDNKDLPENHWRHIPLPSKDAELSLPNLKSLTTYYVKVNIRNTDGSVIHAPSLYRFTTIDSESEFAEVREANALSYRNLVPGKVAIAWNFPESVSETLAGTTVYFSEHRQQPIESWNKVDLAGSGKNSVVLANLREGAQYFIRIVPVHANGHNDFENQEQFEMRTDTRERFEEQLRSVHHASLPLIKGDKSFLRITSCNPDAILDECGLQETCIAVREDGVGWCIPFSLKDAILHS